MSKPTIQITIVDDSRGEKCQAECGIAWSSPESIALAGRRIRERFGDKTRLEYLDLSQTPVSPRISVLSQQIKDKNLSLPLLLINSQSRISGQFDIRQMLDAIEAEIEIGA